MRFGMHCRYRLLTLLCLGSLAAAGCSSTRVECDCAPGNVRLSSGVPVTQMVTSGDACPTRPTCLHPLNGGQCDEFEILYTAAGNCHIATTAADRRQITLDETVALAAVSSCCGKIYRSSDAQIFIFPAIDAG